MFRLISKYLKNTSGIVLYPLETLKHLECTVDKAKFKSKSIDIVPAIIQKLLTYGRHFILSNKIDYFRIVTNIIE